VPKKWSELFSLTIGGIEYFIQYPLNFNPFTNLAKPRVIVQKTIGGTNYQESDICHSDGKFVLSGQMIIQELQTALWTNYNKASSARDDMVFKSYINYTPERWKVIFSSFVPYPDPNVVFYRSAQAWSLELLIAGKYDPDTGELLP